MSSSIPSDGSDQVVKIDLSAYRHTGTGYRPTGNDYTFPGPEDFLKSLSKHFNKQLASDPVLKAEFGHHYHVKFTALPTGYTVVKHKRPDKTQDTEIHGNFSGIGSFVSAPQFLKHAIAIMRLDLVDSLELRPEFLKQPDRLECECVLCTRSTAEASWIKKKEDQEAKRGQQESGV
ncbi:unnamed protein product [Aureobasidium mustum]|uniref:Cryptic loci regulator 2 N-terminal domain-containing protein n=1 Tax=Aureobasidium mustum TaxID=2773714 RepID=A0A9N8JCR2_9PEZI|nr:unnamed protein product [Aureobasidium mustum]